MLIPIETEITAVTVYPDRALVTRQGTIHLTGSETILAIAPLPTTLDPESVRVSGRGQVAVKLQGVSVERQYTTEPVGDRLAQITADIERLESEKTHLQAQIDSLVLQSDFIQGLRQKAEDTFSRSLASQRIGLEDTLNLLNFMGTQHTEYAYATATLRQQQQQLEKQVQALLTQANQLKRPRSQESFQINVAILAIAPAENPANPTATPTGEFQLEVTYVVERASWKPLYDLRVQRAENLIQLSYLAEITQTSGEDWPKVDLTLSTAKPGLGTLPPQLVPWYIDVPTTSPQMMRRVAQPSRTAMAPAPTLSEAGGSANFDQDEVIQAPLGRMVYEAETTVAEVSQQGSVVTFQLGGGTNVPSDGNPHKATILYDRMPCQFTYLAMPRLVSFAYLQARAKNRGDGATLLPGKANIFRDEMFVGTTQLEHIAPGQEFKLNLGIDEGIKINRELIERQADKKLLGSHRRITYAYRMTMHNLGDRPVQLELNDQIPHSRNDHIKVKLTKITPQITLGELGRLNWVLDLAANSNLEVYYQFTIEFPEHTQIIGLNL